MTSPSASELEARMVECARQALDQAKAEMPETYAFGPEALHQVWQFVHEMIGDRAGSGAVPKSLIEGLLAINDPDGRALAGAAREAARRLAADAGVELPPPGQDAEVSPLAGVADRTLAVFLAKKANLFHAGAAWGVSEAGFWTERAAAYLFRREPIFRPPAEWVASYACWKAKRWEGAQIFAVPSEGTRDERNMATRGGLAEG